MYALTTPGVVNAGCEFNIETLQPTYKLLIGVPDNKCICHFKKLGISDYIIVMPRRDLLTMRLHLRTLLLTLMRQNVRLSQKKLKSRYTSRKLSCLREEIKHERQKTNDSKNKILQNANEQAANILAEAKAFADKAIKVMNTSGVTVKELEEERSKLREKTKMRQEKSVSKAPAKKKSTDKPEDYKPGVRVLVHDMDSYGEILTPPDKKNECTVLIGNFKLKQNIRNLQIVELHSLRKRKQKHHLHMLQKSVPQVTFLSPEITFLYELWMSHRST